MLLAHPTASPIVQEDEDEDDTPDGIIKWVPNWYQPLGIGMILLGGATIALTFWMHSRDGKDVEAGFMAVITNPLAYFLLWGWYLLKRENKLICPHCHEILGVGKEPIGTLLRCDTCKNFFRKP